MYKRSVAPSLRLLRLDPAAAITRAGSFFKGSLLVGAYIATVPLANFLITNVGTKCIPNGPCLIPVAPGFMAPSGVLVIGLALVLRDAVHERLGWKWAVAALAVGAALSGLVAPAPLVIASVCAFLFSELCDLSVYAPLRKRNLAVAVMLSGLVGALIDSAIFLWVAFGSLDYLAGQVIGKFWASFVAMAWLLWRRK
jgi:uncharacterized PurR-regulated membrane protein YhhQ (DUF165 family)